MLTGKMSGFAKEEIFSIIKYNVKRFDPLTAQRLNRNWFNVLRVRAGEPQDPGPFVDKVYDTYVDAKGYTLPIYKITSSDWDKAVKC